MILIIFNCLASMLMLLFRLKVNYNCILTYNLLSNKQKLMNWHCLIKQHNFNCLILQILILNLLKNFDRIDICSLRLEIDYLEYTLIFHLLLYKEQFLLKGQNKIVLHISLLYNFHKKHNLLIQMH